MCYTLLTYTSSFSCIGTISQTEFIDCFQALGLNIPRDQALRLFDIADVDKSKTVTLQEFGILYDIFKEEIRKHSR